ncbi:MAG: hypothetical protein KGO96_12185 [Elusimicrobia bacterium]|nr:hypothetical protein [Elusimicrobiota bacterium]MDE2426655.1 hypothetical protein [Elusimicrobiota bacterium]
MKISRSALAALLSALLAVEPCAAAWRQTPEPTPGGALPIAALLTARTLAQPSLSLTLGAALSAAPGLSQPPLAALAGAAGFARVVPALPPPAAPAAAGLSAPLAQRLSRTQAAAASAIADVERSGAEQGRAQAARQFSALTGERLADGSMVSGAASTAPGDGLAAEPAPLLPSGAAAEHSGEPPISRRWLRVFHDPERDGAFWRYLQAKICFLFGFNMYLVGGPYLVSAFTRNSLREHRDRRAADLAAVAELVRRNRALLRLAHWLGQVPGYLSIPLFTRHSASAGPKKWLVRACLLRGAALAGVVGMFFATGYVSLGTALWAFCALLAAQSFFQGVSVTLEQTATTRLFGDKDVFPEERTRANSILTAADAAVSIAAPAVAGQIALLGPLGHKTGVGGAVIYGVYAVSVAAMGLLYSTIRLFSGPGRGQAAASAPFPGLWASLKDGLRLILRDRFLRTLLLISVVSSLFSDPLVFNVLPEYIEGLVAQQPGSLGAILNVPVLGWFLKTLTATPMGNFALMMTVDNVGIMLSAIAIKPLSRLLARFGFKTEEALAAPYYFIAALEAPLFLLMFHAPSILGVVGLYGLQSVAIGFVGIAIQGLYQKNLGEREEDSVNKILAANSLLGILAALLATAVYGFWLTGIPIGTSMAIAAAATGAVCLLRLAAPFLAFSKEQRHLEPDAPSAVGAPRPLARHWVSNKH